MATKSDGLVPAKRCENELYEETLRRDTRRRTSSEALELLRGEPELAEDLVEEGWSDLPATVDGNRHRPAIGVVPSLVAAGLATPDEAELTSHPLEVPRGGARHSRFR
jgi:hypothetical protein